MAPSAAVQLILRIKDWSMSCSSSLCSSLRIPTIANISGAQKIQRTHGMDDRVPAEYLRVKKDINICGFV